MNKLAALDEILSARIAALAPKMMVAGFVGGMYPDGEQAGWAGGSFRSAGLLPSGTGADRPVESRPWR